MRILCHNARGFWWVRPFPVTTSGYAPGKRSFIRYVSRRFTPFVSLPFVYGQCGWSPTGASTCPPAVKHTQQWPNTRVLGCVSLNWAVNDDVLPDFFGDHQKIKTQLCPFSIGEQSGAWICVSCVACANRAIWPSVPLLIYQHRDQLPCQRL